MSISMPSQKRAICFNISKKGTTFYTDNPMTSYSYNATGSKVLLRNKVLGLHDNLTKISTRYLPGINRSYRMLRCYKKNKTLESMVHCSSTLLNLKKIQQNYLALCSGAVVHTGKKQRLSHTLLPT